MFGLFPTLLSAIAFSAIPAHALAVPSESSTTAQGDTNAIDLTAPTSANSTALSEVMKRWTDSGMIYDGEQKGNTAVCYGKTSDQTHPNCGGKGASFDYVVMVGIWYAQGKGCQSIQDRLNAKLSKSNKGGITDYLCDELFRDHNTILHFNACKGQGGDITAELHGIYPTVPSFGCPVWHDKMP